MNYFRQRWLERKWRCCCGISLSWLWLWLSDYGLDLMKWKQEYSCNRRLFWCVAKQIYTTGHTTKLSPGCHSSLGSTSRDFHLPCHPIINMKNFRFSPVKFCFIFLSSIFNLNFKIWFLVLKTTKKRNKMRISFYFLCHLRL